MTPIVHTTSTTSYEQSLKDNPRFAMSEMGAFFEGNSKVHRALAKVTRKLNELGIAYAVAGGMALFQHGYRRTTDDIDILVTKSDLRKIHENLSGLGYLPPFKDSKHLRDVQEGVRIEFITTGDYPGDGKPKAIAFPNPESVAIERDGIKYLNLIPLIELKLASGTSASHRRRDLVDVQELIRALQLPLEFGQQLDMSIRPEFERLWAEINVPRRYVRLWRNKWLTANADSIDGMTAKLRAAAELLENMRRDGVILETASAGISDDYATLITTDPDIAEKYDMHPEEDTMSSEDHVAD